MNPDFLLLLLAAFAAGFIDAVIGGGGLIQLPAVMFYMPEAPLPTVFGTNKFSGFVGTAWASVSYSLKTTISKAAVVPALITALPFAYIGAQAVSSIDKEELKPYIILLFSLVAIYTFIKKDFGLGQGKKLSVRQMTIFSLASGAVIGFYDGFFGPGTGSFLVFIYVFIFGFNFLQASASAKIVNTTTNLAALYFFFNNGNIQFSVAIPIALFNLSGAALGTKLALQKGSGFIRKAFLFIVCSFIAKMLYDYLSPFFTK